MGTLREIAQVYDILRKAIEVRKDEFCSLKLDIVSRDPDRRRARTIIRDQREKIEEIEAFFAFPDRVHSWQSWLRLILEDYFVIDAVTIWKWRDFSNKLIGLRVLDGALIKPMLNVQGDIPAPPDIAYQQYVWGVARWMFTADELIYAPKNKRINSAYGFSPVEQFITHISLALRFQRFQLDYFTDGTLPEGVAEVPASWSKKQIDEFEQAWTAALAGDTRMFHRLQFVPSGFKFHNFKEPQHIFSTDFGRWLLGVTCAAMDLMPQELGFEPQHGGLGGKGFSEEQSIINKRKAIKPLATWLCDEILNPIIWNEFKAPGLKAVFREDTSTDEKLSQMQARDLQIRNGSMSIDEAIEEDGGEPIGVGRLFVFGTSVLGEPDLIALSKVGAAALNVQGSPLPEGHSQAPAGITAQEAHPPSPDAITLDPQQALLQSRQQVQVESQQSQRMAHQEETDPRANDRSELEHGEVIKTELDTFNRYVKARKRDGKWRDFKSTVFPAPVLTALNESARQEVGV